MEKRHSTISANAKSKRSRLKQSRRAASLSGRGAIMFTNSKQLKVSERKDAFEHGYSDLDTPTPSEKVSQWHRDIFLTTPAGIGESEVEQQVHPRQCVCDSCMTEYGTYKFYNNMMTKSFSEVDKTQEKGPQKEKSNIMYVCEKIEQGLFPSPSSTSGTDSSIRLHKTRVGCTERRWFIGVSLAMIFSVTIASVGIYFGYMFLRSHLPPTEAVFRGNFFIHPPASNSSVPLQLPDTKNFQHKLDVIVSGSSVAKSYLHNEVFLIEENKIYKGTTLSPKEEGVVGALVHFNLHMKPLVISEITGDEEELSAEDVFASILTVLRSMQRPKEFSANDTTLSFGGYLMDVESLVLQERTTVPPTATEDNSVIDFNAENEHNEISSDASTIKSCSLFEIEFCAQLPYNFTAFPNGMGHNNVGESFADIEKFKEIVDSKCYSLSYEFLCQLLQPVCYDKKIVLPCREFCLDFINECGNILSRDLLERLDCQRFGSESDGPGGCISKPGCVAEIRNNNKESRICDGVVDCPDFTDELYCPYCPEHHFHCGVGKTCVPKERLCDGTADCPNGADENGCLSIAPNMEFSSYVHRYYNKGYLVYQQGGNAGKVCAGHLNRSVPDQELQLVLDKMGQSMCDILDFNSLDTIQVLADAENNERDSIRYVDMISPNANGVGTFITVPCLSREVIFIECSDLRCGKAPARINSEVLSFNNVSATHGDWPWHVALHKDGQHVCDGTLIHANWLMTTAACFQGQGRAKWVARFAAVRLESRAPWEQERRIIGMVKSPVEGNSIVLLKLDRPVTFSDFIRPICLPSSDEFIHLGAVCVTLGWTSSRNELQLVFLETAEREICKESSELSANSICTQNQQNRYSAEENRNDCEIEEFAGAPFVCKAGDRWHLVGVSSWRRRGCGPTVHQRPRIYDRVSLSTEWAKKVISRMEN